METTLYCYDTYKANNNGMQEAKLERRRQRLKRYEDYLKGSSSAADPERDEINDLLNRHVHTFPRVFVLHAFEIMCPTVCTTINHTYQSA